MNARECKRPCDHSFSVLCNVLTATSMMWAIEINTIIEISCARSQSVLPLLIDLTWDHSFMTSLYIDAVYGRLFVFIVLCEWQSLNGLGRFFFLKRSNISVISDRFIQWFLNRIFHWRTIVNLLLKRSYVTTHFINNGFKLSDFNVSLFNLFDVFIILSLFDF